MEGGRIDGRKGGGRGDGVGVVAEEQGGREGMEEALGVRCWRRDIDTSCCIQWAGGRGEGMMRIFSVAALQARVFVVGQH